MRKSYPFLLTFPHFDSYYRCNNSCTSKRNASALNCNGPWRRLHVGVLWTHMAGAQIVVGHRRHAIHAVHHRWHPVHLVPCREHRWCLRFRNDDFPLERDIIQKCIKTKKGGAIQRRTFAQMLRKNRHFKKNAFVPILICEREKTKTVCEIFSEKTLLLPLSTPLQRCRVPIFVKDNDLFIASRGGLFVGPNATQLGFRIGALLNATNIIFSPHAVLDASQAATPAAGRGGTALAAGPACAAADPAGTSEMTRTQTIYTCNYKWKTQHLQQMALVHSSLLWYKQPFLPPQNFTNEYFLNKKKSN